MTAIPQRRVPTPPTQTRRLAPSQRLLDPLHLVAGRVRLLSFLRAFFQLIVLTLGVWLVLSLFLGSIREIPVPFAIALASLAWLSLFGGIVWFFRPVLRHADLSSTARLIDAALPDTDERISSALELTQETDPRFQGSTELIAALVRQAEHAAERLDPTAVVSGRNVFRWFLGTIPLFFAWFVLFVVLTPTLTLGVERIFQPWRAATPLPTATLDVAPQNVTVAQGSDVLITLSVTPVGPAAASADQRVDGATITSRYTAGNTNEDVTKDMQATDSHSFRANFDNVQQTFSYRVASLGAQSPTYTVTVDPRPTVNSIQVDYTYPAYTSRPPHSETSREGAIDALVGTQVKLTINTTQPVKSARVVITDNAPDPATFTLVPIDKTNTTFTTDFTVRKTTDYKVQLTNEHELENADNQAHPIIARLDAPPQIAITSPTENVLKVRPDDTVAVRFTATDDLALTKIEAITQVDDRPPTMFLLPAIPPRTTTLNGEWPLSLHDLLSTIAVAPPALPAPKRVTYQFRATDNRDPDAQTGYSAKQILDLDQNVTPLAEREDAQAARTLGEAVKQASSELDDAKDKLDKLRQTAASRPLTEDEKQQAADARREIGQAAQALQNAADKTSDSRPPDPPRQARDIADQPIRKAEENAAAGQLASDQPDIRNKSLDAAGQNLADARQKLDQLGRDIDQKAKDQPLGHELERIAAEQKKTADALAQNPNDPALLDRQRQLQRDLDNVIKNHPEMQKPAAEAAQANMQDVQKKLDDIQKAQQPFNDQAKAQADAAVAQDKLNDLANQQEKLNQQINDFNSKQSEPLRQADAARSPDQPQLDSIPKDLRSRNLAGAAQKQNANATQLEQAARQLENARKREQESPDQIAKNKQAAKDAADFQQQANDLQKQIDDAQKNHDPPTRPSDPANQQATKLADQIKREAQQMSQSPSQRNAAKDAMDDADAAKRDAAQGDAQSAQQHLASAASKLASAAGQSAPSNSSQGNSAAEAAAQARDLARQQRALADQTSQTSRSLDDAAAARSNAEQSAQQQQQVADKMEQAAKAAHDLQQQTQGSAPDLSQRAGQAAQALQKAADAQRAAAQATRDGNTSQAADQQSQAAAAAAAAQQSLSNQGDPNSPGQSPSQDAAAQSVQAARNAQSQAAAGNPAAAQKAADELTKASQEILNGNNTSSGQAAPTPTGSANATPNTPNQQASPHSPDGAGTSPGATQISSDPGGSGSGIKLQKTASSPSIPKSVEDIGVSPSDWARLPATMQEQLLNSAQQSGPPAYRDMIKSYYSRIAQIQQQPGAPQ